MAERLLHYSAQPFVGPVKSAVRKLLVSSKPTGLWVSVEGEDDWPNWCRGEQFSLDALRYVSEIILQPKAKILRLSCAADIDMFTAELDAPIIPGLDRHRFKGSFIDWPKLARAYDGIVIAPYIWHRRLDGGTRWYYGWDCASGCIWRPRAIADIRPIAAAQAEAA